MNQEIFKPKFIFWAKILSKVLSPIFFIYSIKKARKNLPSINNIKTILVTEYYCIGDILIILPAIESLRKHFIKAKIILVCSFEAEPLARTLKAFDVVIPFDAKWKKRPLSIYKIWQSREFACSFKKKNIDLAIDFRGDIRNNWFLYQIKSKYSIGYGFTGGHYFLDKTIEFPYSLHQKDRALHLISSIGVPKYIKNCKTNYNEGGYLVLHPGAGDSARTWSNKLWIELATALVKEYKVAIVEVNETIGIIDSLVRVNQSLKIFRGSLGQFSIWLKNQRLLIGPDSMAGHLASYLNIPVISIFGSQNPELTKPNGPSVRVLEPVEKCTHKREHWRLCKPCIETVKPVDVLNVVNEIFKIK